MSSEIICIVDRSGSMGGMVKEAIGGFNTFLKEQQAIPDDSCKFTLVMFDHEYNKVYDAADIQSVSELTDQTYVPRGTTALYDAMGRALDEAIDRIQKEYATLPRVAVMVMTDGQENASKDYTKGRLEKLVEDLKKDNWQFVFLSSDLNSFNVDLGSMTVGTSSLGYGDTAYGYSTAYTCASQNVAQYRSMGIINTDAVLLNDDGTKNKLKIAARDTADTQSSTTNNDVTT
jgi:Mg-chelatase subunit ChlD